MILWYLSASCTSKNKVANTFETNSTHICENVKTGDPINYNADIKVNKDFCETDQAAAVKIELVDGSNKDKLILNVSCEKCKCGTPEPNSKYCDGHGELICGGCHCK